MSANNNEIIYLKNIINLLPGNVYWIDRNGINLGCNANILKAHGIASYHEYIGRNYRELFGDEEFKLIKKTDDEVMDNGEAKILEEVSIKNGKVVATYLTHKVPLKNDKGEVIGLLGISFDITERKKEQQQLQEAKVKEKLLEEKIQAIKAAAATIAHELRTPLRAISNNAQAQKYLATIIEGYEMAKEANLPVKNIRPAQLAGIKQALTGITKETEYANSFIDMLLVNIRELENDTSKHKVYSIANCINEALARYPFNSDEQHKLVTWNNDTDFIFKGEQLLIIHIELNRCAVTHQF